MEMPNGAVLLSGVSAPPSALTAVPIIVVPGPEPPAGAAPAANSCPQQPEPTGRSAEEEEEDGDMGDLNSFLSWPHREGVSPELPHGHVFLLLFFYFLLFNFAFLKLCIFF